MFVTATSVSVRDSGQSSLLRVLWVSNLQYRTGGPHSNHSLGGHEGAGVVVAVGSKIGNVQVGDHVGVKVS